MSDNEKYIRVIKDILGHFHIYQECDEYMLDIFGTDYDFKIAKETYDVLKEIKDSESEDE